MSRPALTCVAVLGFLMAAACVAVLGFLMAAPVSAAVLAARVTITTLPTLISQSGSELGPVLIKNLGPASVYLGGVNVAATTGYELSASETISISLGAGEAVYGIVETGTVIVHKLENRK